MLDALKDAAKTLLLRSGIVISRTPGQFNLGELRLRRLREGGFRSRCAVDGGAADGGWAQEFRAVFPEAHVLCVEPRGDCQPQLEAVARSLGNVSVAKTLLGADEGSARLHVHAAQSSMLNNSSDRHFGETVECSMTTLDFLVKRLGLPWPDLVKLDLQGAELLCLGGAAECLRHAEVVILEVSFFPFYAGNPLIGDVIPFMTERGFRCYDIAGLWRRPLDNALAQGDFFFVKNGSPLLADSRWSESSAWS